MMKARPQGKLGFWWRLAIVGGFLVLLAVPAILFVDITNSYYALRQVEYEFCMSLVPPVSEGSAIPQWEGQASCIAQRDKPSPAQPGWDEYTGLLFGSAVTYIFAIALILCVVLVAKWVWRGREQA